MLLTPALYDQTSPYDLLLAAERGLLGFDHRLIRSFDARRPAACADLARFCLEVSSQREDGKVVDLEEPCFDLWRYFRVPEAVPFYLHLLAKYREEIPDSLVEALAELGEPAVEPLLAYYDSLTTEDESSDVLFILASLGIRDPRILQRITACLDRDPYEAAICFGAYGDPATLPLLDAAIARLGDARPDERRALTEARGTISTVEARRDFPPFDILDLYPEEADPLFDALASDQVAAFLDCSIPAWRAGAAGSFQDDAYSDAIRDQLLRAATADPDVEVRRNALRALGERAHEPSVHAFLLGILEDSSHPAPVRSGALVGLSLDASQPAFQAKLAELYSQPDTRAAALEAMWRSQDRRHAVHFIRDLDHPDVEVCRQAMIGLGVLELSKEASRLEPFFDREDLRTDALYAYALCCPGRTTRQAVRKMMDHIDDLAGGLSSMEMEVVESALDTRLERAGLEPVFHHHADEEEEGGEAAPPVEQVFSDKVGRNDPCPCGSGKKYKKCHGAG